MSQPNEHEHTHGEHHSSSHHEHEHHSTHHHSGSGGSSHHSSSHHAHHSSTEQHEHHSSSSRSGEHHSSGHHHHSDRSEQKRDALIRKYQVVEETNREEMKGFHHHHHRHHHRRSKGKRILMAVACVPLVLILALGTTFAVLNAIGRRQVAGDGAGVQANPYSVTYDGGKTVEYNGVTYTLNENIVTIAAMGVDRREFGLKDDKIGTAGQADMILVAALDLKSGRITGILIPRDSMVDVDQYTVDGTYVGVERMQVCLSFAYGDGRDTSGQNVLTSAERILYGIPIHMYGVLDLDGIGSLNDAIGGVTVTALETYGSFVAGEPVTLQGGMAEEYVRERNTAVLDSDTPRRARQIQYLQAFVRKGIQSAISDFGIVPRLYNAATQYGFTNVSLSKATYLATTLLTKGVSFDDFVSLKGELRDAEPYPEYILDNQAVFETVLQVFYTPGA